jgi:hypothetical protein
VDTIVQKLLARTGFLTIAEVMRGLKPPLVKER